MILNIKEAFRKYSKFSDSRKYMFAKSPGKWKGEGEFGEGEFAKINVLQVQSGD